MIFDFQYLLDFFSANGIIKSIEICTIRHRLLKVIYEQGKNNSCKGDGKMP